jgi:hypothetical protein
MHIAAIGLSRGIALTPHCSRHIPSRLASWLVLGRTQSVAKECCPADQAAKERVRCQGEMFRATSQAHRILFTHSEVCHQHSCCKPRPVVSEIQTAVELRDDTIPSERVVILAARRPRSASPIAKREAPKISILRAPEHFQMSSRPH